MALLYVEVSRVGEVALLHSGVLPPVVPPPDVLPPCLLFLSGSHDGSFFRQHAVILCRKNEQKNERRKVGDTAKTSPSSKEKNLRCPLLQVGVSSYLRRTSTCRERFSSSIRSTQRTLSLVQKHHGLSTQCFDTFSTVNLQRRQPSAPSTFSTGNQPDTGFSRANGSCLMSYLEIGLALIK